MKLIILALMLSTSSALFAASECEENNYRLTKAGLVVAFDLEEAAFHPQTAHHIVGEFFFNGLLDQSCRAIEVSKGGEVSCVSSKGMSKIVGTLAGKIGLYADYLFYRVNWSQDVVIKSLRTDNGCVYGIAIK